MWHDVEERALPRGVIGTDKKCSRVIIGADTVRAWKLDRFSTVTLKKNSAPGLVAFQLHTDDKGTRKLGSAGSGGETLQISCQTVLHEAQPHTRYLAKREADSLIVVDFSRPVPVGWTPQHGHGR